MDLKKHLWLGVRVAILVGLVGSVLRYIFGNSLEQFFGLLPASNPVSLSTFALLATYGFIAGFILAYWK